MYIFACTGALLLWLRLRSDLRSANSLSEFFDNILGDKSKLAAVAKLSFFILFGGFIGVLFVSPSTPVQAASAGMAWTRLAAKD